MADFVQRNDTGPASGTATTAGTANSLFSKFARSPSRKHKPRPSSESIDASVAGPVKAAAPRTRPGPQRVTTAPDGVSTVNSLAQAELGRRKASDAAGSLQQVNETKSTMFVVPSLGAAELGTPAYKFVANDIPKVPPLHGGAAYNPMVAITALNPNTLYQHIHDMSSKRVATLDYMRKAYAGSSTVGKHMTDCRQARGANVLV
jgi:hypothetical protein